jgi:hypothetical protein
VDRRAYLFGSRDPDLSDSPRLAASGRYQAIEVRLSWACRLDRVEAVSP